MFDDIQIVLVEETMVNDLYMTNSTRGHRERSDCVEEVHLEWSIRRRSIRYLNLGTLISSKCIESSSIDWLKCAVDLNSRPAGIGVLIGLKWRLGYFLGLVEI